MDENQVNLATRRAYAQCLRQLTSGRLSYREYDARAWSIFSSHGDDAASIVIHESVSDVFEPEFTFTRHARVGAWLDARTKNEIACCILFLYTESRFVIDSPPMSIYDRIVGVAIVILLLLTAGLAAVNALGFALFFLFVLIVVVIMVSAIYSVIGSVLLAKSKPAATATPTPEVPWPFASVSDFDHARNRRIFFRSSSTESTHVN